jgi:pimeloyl-ACP methyl ester carboxylesterase
MDRNSKATKKDNGDAIVSSAIQTGQRIMVGRCEVHVHRKGAGVPVLYLHGTEGMSELGTGLESLAQAHDVIAPDHPGYGQSGDSDLVETMADLRVALSGTTSVASMAVM